MKTISVSLISPFVRSRGRFAAVLLAALASCSRAPVKPEPPAPPNESPSTSLSATPVNPRGNPLTVSTGTTSPLVAKPLTGSGENSDGRFSPDGSRIVFVSRFRPTHKQAQVYELHLGRMMEKRITYHDGDDAGPLYTPDGERLLFASTTDEIKSPGYAVQRLMKTYAPDLASKNTASEAGFEIYEQTLHGRSIDRLSQSPGFDGDADVEPKSGKRIVFSSSRTNDGTHLFLQTLQNGKSAPIRLTEGKVIDRGARFSSDGAWLVWSRQELGKNGELPSEARLMIASGNFRKSKPLVEARGLNLQAAWHPGGADIVFSSNMAGKHFNLYSVDTAGTCLRRLTNAEVDHLQPAFSPDGKQIIFTSSRTPGNGESQQIFIMDYVKPADCWQPPAPAEPISTPSPQASPVPSSGETKSP